MEMAQSYKRRTPVKDSFIELFWKLIALVALGGCSVLGWYLFELARHQKLDNAFAEFYRMVTVTLQVVFRLDPVLALIVFPFAIVVIMILIGLLIWLHKDR